MRQLQRLIVALCSLLFSANAHSADWPQYRYDVGRTAASPERLPEQLYLTWVKVLPSPQPAFPAEIRLRYDASYEPVVLGTTMFVPSMVTDSVTALDTESGDECWRFFTGGPVRFAPVASNGRVYFVSDDGYRANPRACTCFGRASDPSAVTISRLGQPLVASPLGRTQQTAHTSPRPVGALPPREVGEPCPHEAG